MIPPELVPNGLLISSIARSGKILQEMESNNLKFPVVVKPDIGERGFRVELINNIDELMEYLPSNEEQIIVQEYIDLPLELGVFYYRIPDEKSGTVTSVVIKGMMKVRGDGVSTIKQLMAKNDRTRLQIHRLIALTTIDLMRIPGLNEEVLLEPIGNHNRGTAFLNGNHLINQRLIDVIDKLSCSIDGFFYGRYDLRCRDEEALYAGNFMILELNGAASEPAHIYAPGYPLLQGYKDLFFHWRILFKISKMNHKRGVPYMPLLTGIAALKKSRFAKRA